MAEMFSAPYIPVSEPISRAHRPAFLHESHHPNVTVKWLVIPLLAEWKI
jgi:hypothetical protein